MPRPLCPMPVSSTAVGRFQFTLSESGTKFTLNSSAICNKILRRNPAWAEPCRHQTHLLVKAACVGKRGQRGQVGIGRDVQITVPDGRTPTVGTCWAGGLAAGAQVALGGDTQLLWSEPHRCDWIPQGPYSGAHPAPAASCRQPSFSRRRRPLAQLRPWPAPFGADSAAHAPVSHAPSVCRLMHLPLSRSPS